MAAISSPQDFKVRIVDRISELAQETGGADFRMPIGLFLVLDEANGGNEIAGEVIRRFRFLDSESANVIDFYLAGWRRDPHGGPLVFNLDDFQSFRAALRAHGITAFGGNADLLLFDACRKGGRVLLDFTQVIQVRLDDKRVGEPGSFLQALIGAAEAIRRERTSQHAVYSISDRLGLARAGESLLETILGKWGAFFGADRLSALAIKSAGPAVDLARL